MIALELFLQLVQITVAATLVSIILRKLNQPNLFSYIVAGILIGPLVIGRLDFSFLNLPFELGIRAITPEVSLLSELGAAFLLFSIGIETSVKRLMTIGKAVFFGTLMQVLGVVAVTVGLTYLTGLVSFEASLFIGTILAFSSTMVVIKLLADRKETNTLNGRIIIAILLIQDFLIIFFVPLLQNISEIGNPAFFIPVFAKIACLVAVALISNKLIFPRLFNIASKENELFFLASLSTAFLFIGVSWLLNIPISIGAFIGGLALSSLPYNTAIFSKIRALRDFFLTIFFVSLGAQLSFSFGALPLMLMVIIVLLIFIFKPLVFSAVALVSGYGGRLSLSTGISLAQSSEFGFVIASLGAVALTANGATALSSELVSFIVTIIAISMVMTPHMVNHAGGLSDFLLSRTPYFKKITERTFLNRKISVLRNMPDEDKLKDHVVIAGGGLIARIVAKKLSKKEEVYLVDSDPEVVIQGQNDGFKFIYGTSEDTEIFDKLDLNDAKFLLVTMVNHKEGINFINTARKLYPKITIIATANHFYDALDYYEKHVDFVSMPNLIGVDSLVTKLDGFSSKKKIFASESEKKKHLEYIRAQANEELKYRKRLMA